MNKYKTIIIAVVAVVAAAILGFGCICTIPEGYVGAKYRLGQLVATDLAPGLNLKLPFVESITKIDVKEQIYEMVTTAYTKDTQTVESVKVKVNYYLDKSQLSTIIREIGVNNVESKLVIPQLNSILKNHTGKYKAEELIAFRTELQENVEQDLRDSLKTYGIVVSAVNVEDIDFEDSFEDTIRAKVAAEQEALRVQNETVAKEEQARQKVIAAQAEAESIRITAQAQAEANKLLSESLSQNLIDYKKIEKWNGEYPTVMGDSVNPFVTLN